MKNHIKIFAIVLVVFLAASCTPFVRPEQPYQTKLLTLLPGHAVGQTFTARYDGLESIIVYLEPGESDSGSINLHLRESPLSDTNLRFSSIPYSQIKNPGYYTFQFSPITGSSISDYYFFIKNQGDSQILLSSGDYFTYIHGALYIDHTPQDQQLTFKLAYNQQNLASGLAKEAFFWFLWLMASVFLFIIPGWALLSLLSSNWKRYYWGIRLGLALGLSLAIYPILFLWTDLFNIHLGRLYAWLPPILGLGSIIWQNRKHLTGFSFSKSKFKNSIRSKDFFPDLVLLIAIAFTFVVRLWVVRTLSFPLWGDSYQHTMVVQLLVDNGGLFESWLPYAELQTFTYHFGFHSLVAVFHWVTALSNPQAVLILGQLLNGFAVIALIPLALKINPSRWNAVFSVLFAGLLFQMPMFYVNWGRYTQLAGQVILPAAIFLVWNALEKDKVKVHILIACWIIIAGLGLTHYRVLIFSILFFPTYFLLDIQRFRYKTIMIRSLWMGLGVGIIFLPWFIRVFGGKWMSIFQHYISIPANSLPTNTVAYNSIGDITVYLPRYIWLILPIVLAWGFYRRSKKISMISLWSYLIFLVANPHWLNIPGAGTLTNFAVFIAAYIPASLILATAASWMIENIQKILWKTPEKHLSKLKLRKIFYPLLILLILLLGLFGVRQRFHDMELNNHTFVTHPDQRAFDWIQENTAAEDRFLVISFPAYGNSMIAGADAGWWIPLIANRQSTLPPLLYGSEEGPKPEYQAWITSLTLDIIEKGINNPEIISLLEERRVKYIYIGQQRGRINNPAPFLTPESLLADHHFEPIYHQDGVWIFQIEYSN